MKKNQLTTTRSTALTLGKTKSLMSITKKLLEGKSKELTTHEDITIIGNLMWGKDTQEWMSWDEAMEYAKKLRLGGYDDWRLPTREELREVVTLCGGVAMNDDEDDLDGTKNIANEAYQANYQEKGFIPDGYWSSTTTADRSDSAWIVNFEYCIGTNDYIDSATYHVRCVR